MLPMWRQHQGQRGYDVPELLKRRGQRRGWFRVEEKFPKENFRV